MSDTAPIKELTLTRTFNAPRELVFKVWTDEKHLSQWWGPHGFSNPVCKVDVRVGGSWNVVMSGYDMSHPMGGTFHEIVPPERLVFTTTAFQDEEGGPGLEVLNTVVFEEIDGKTNLTLHAVVVRAAASTARALEGMDQGWSESLEKLGAYIEKLQ